MKYQKTIGIFAGKVKGLNPWDPDTIKSGISGSEEAVIYISQQLAELGFRVLVFGNPPIHSQYTNPDANPCFLSCETPITLSNPLDIAIAWRMPGIANYLKSMAAKIYLWPHDTLTSPVPLDQIDGFDDVLWLSKWQRKQWISVSPSFSKFTNIFGNGIQPEQFRPVQERTNPYSCIYGSCWNRGLEILLDLWPHIKQRQPRATLDLYYGCKLFAPDYPEKAAKLRKQIVRLQDVHDHGQVGHEELNRAYEKASFWTYPCTWPETFCITALRAQAAGAVPVIHEQCALAETVKHGFKCTNVNDYLSTLLGAFQKAERISVDDRRQMGKFVLEEFTWKTVAIKWMEVFAK